MIEHRVVPCTHKILACVCACMCIWGDRESNDGQETVAIMATFKFSVPMSQQGSWMLGSSLWWRWQWLSFPGLQLCGRILEDNSPGRGFLMSPSLTGAEVSAPLVGVCSYWVLQAISAALFLHLFLWFCKCLMEMATHSSVLAWRIPGTAEPVGLPSMGSQSQTRLKWLSSSSSNALC